MKGWGINEALGADIGIVGIRGESNNDWGEL